MNHDAATEKLHGRNSESICKIGKAKQMQKKIQSKLVTDVDDDEHGRLLRNADARKTATIFNLQEQMIETIRSKKIRGMTDQEQCRLCSKFKETV